MPTRLSKKEIEEMEKNNLTDYVSKVEIDPNMPDFSNSPFLLKKAEIAMEILDKANFPEEFYKRK